MIVPRSRLLFWVGCLAVPAAAIATAGGPAATAALLLIAALVLAAVADAALGIGGVEGVSVELPEVVRLTKDREGPLVLRVHNAGAKAKALRVGIALPQEIQTTDEVIESLLPGGHQHSMINLRCTGLRRGRYDVTLAAIEIESPLGFWGVRKRLPVRSELRVYPNLMSERKSLAALFMNRGNFGVHAQRQVGKGREFEQLREYIPGDGFEDVHWRATAKRGRPVTKVFQIERTQEVYVIIDTSRLSGRESITADQNGGGRMTVLERYLTAGLVLGMAAERQGDLFGLLAFGDKVQRFVRASNGREHYAACRDAIYNLHPQLTSPDFEEVCTFIRLRLRRRALLIFLTSLDDPILAEHFVRDVQLISRQHLVLVNMLQPAGVQAVFGNQEIGDIDAVYQELGNHLRWHELRELEKVLQRRGVSFSRLQHEKLSAQLVTQYLSVKRRQVL